METQSQIYISFKQNPAMQEALSGKQIGDEAPKIEVKSKIKELNTDGVMLVVDAYIPDGFEEAEDEKSETAVMPMMAGGSPSDETIPSQVASALRRKKA